jgi:hypothetical protein
MRGVTWKHHWEPIKGQHVEEVSRLCLDRFGRSSQAAFPLLLWQGDCLVGPWVCLVCTGAVLSRLHALVGSLIHVRLNSVF